MTSALQRHRRRVGQGHLAGGQQPLYNEDGSLVLIANGEIWSVHDALRCREVTGCDTLMIGRGMVRNPGLALAIVAADRSAMGLAPGVPGIAWANLLPLIADFWRLIARHVEPRHRSGRS